MDCYDECLIAGVRVGAAIQAAEVSLGPGAGAPGQPHPPHAHPGNGADSNAEYMQ